MKLSARLILAYVSLILIIIFTAFSYAKIDPESAVGIWFFDEGTGKTAKDSSENNNDGTLENSPKWAEGKLDKALEFDGKDNYVKVPDTESLDITDAITIVGWVYPNFYGQSDSKKPIGGDGSSVNILSKMVSENSYIGPFWWEYRNNGNLNTYFAAVPADTYLTPTIPDLPADKWSHIASTYDSSKGIANIYLNAAVVDTKSNPNFGPLREGIQLLFGTGKGGQYGNYYNGKLDDVAIFHAVLAEKDIDDIMNKGLGRTLGITAVSPSGKLAAVWGSIKK